MTMVTTHCSFCVAGSVRVYDLKTKEVLSHRDFPSGGSSLLWAPTRVESQANTIISGHTDGVIRYVPTVQNRLQSISFAEQRWVSS